MTVKIGRQFAIGFAKETTRGTAPGSASFWVRHTEIGLQEKFDMAKQEFSIGIIEDGVGADIVKQYVEGDIKMPVTDKAIGLLLYNALGAVTTQANTPETGVYTHTFTVLQSSQHPSLALYVDDPASGQDYTHALAMLNSLEINADIGAYASLSATFKAKKGATATLTPAITSENIFRPQDVTLKQASALAGLTGASAIPVKKLSLKIEKNLEDDDVLGNVAPQDFYNKQLVITGSIEAIYQNESDFKTNALAGTARAVRITLQNAGVIIGTTQNPTITIDLAKAHFEEIAINRGANDIVTQTLSFKAYYSTTDASSISVVVKNTQTSY